MNDQQDGKSENDATPDLGSEALSGRARPSPVIQGETVKAPGSPSQEAPSAEPAKPEGPEASAAETPRKSSNLRPLLATAGVCILGVAGYYGWTQWASEVAPSPEPVPVAALAPPREETAVAAPPAAVEIDKKAEAPAAPEPAPKSNAIEAKPVEAASEPVKSATVEPPAEKTPAEKSLAEMAARLASTQAALEQVTKRLQAVEGQLAAPKTESRAELAAREAGPSNAGDVSARIVAAQSLLSAIRQGDDYAPMLTALQNFGGDSDRLVRLRAGLTAPDANRLAKDFAALAPKILADAAPPEPGPQQVGTPKNFGQSVLAFLAIRAEKLVRIRPAGAPDDDETVNRVTRIEKDLARGDLVAALAERAQLPAPALALTANWAAGAQARLDAEQAAKAELAAALQGLSKSKS